MYFLNDKFFRVAVILFFLLMALPFMFSTPQEISERTEKNTLEFEDKNPVYKIIGRIAHFYGFKNDKNKDFDLRNKRIELLNKQNAENKKTERNNSKERQKPTPENENSVKNEKITETGDIPSSKNVSYSQNSNKETQEPKYINFKGNTYQVLTDQNNKPYISTKEDSVLLDSLPKNQIYQKIKEPVYSQKGTQTQVSLDEKTSLVNNVNQTPQKTFNQTVQRQTYTSAKTNKTKSTKGFFGRDYFLYQNKKSNDLYSDFNASAKELMELKLNQKGKEQNRADNRTYTKTYKAEVLNPTTGKREIVNVQKQINQEDLEKAEKIKKLTLANIQTYNDDIFVYKDEFNKQTELPFPIKKEIKTLQDNPKLPPHIFITPLVDNENLISQYNSSKKKAEKLLPSNKNDYPILEFVYKKGGNEVLRAPKDSFNVVAVSRILADRVYIPLEEKQNSIDFDDSKLRIYVVPEQTLYDKYKDMGIPVIYYPELSPANLGRVYKSAAEAVETLDKNKRELAKTEQLQNQKAIEHLL